MESALELPVHKCLSTLQKSPKRKIGTADRHSAVGPLVRLCSTINESVLQLTKAATEWAILIMYFVGYGCSFITGTASFRTAWGIQFVPCVFLISGLPFLPRSPRWLAKVDRTEKAIATLANIQADGNRDDPLIVAEWEEITMVLQAERNALPGWRKFVYNVWLSRLIIGIGADTMAGHVEAHPRWLYSANVAAELRR
jgi:hypothetical protein